MCSVCVHLSRKEDRVVRCILLVLFYVSSLEEMVISQYGVEPTMFWCFWIVSSPICLCRVLLFLVFYCPVCFECIDELFLYVFVSCCWLWQQDLCFASSF